MVRILSKLTHNWSVYQHENENKFYEDCELLGCNPMYLRENQRSRWPQSSASESKLSKEPAEESGQLSSVSELHDPRKQKVILFIVTSMRN
jgi:hypothetical protein